MAILSKFHRRNGRQSNKKCKGVVEHSFGENTSVHYQMVWKKDGTDVMSSEKIFRQLTSKLNSSTYFRNTTVSKKMVGKF